MVTRIRKYWDEQPLTLILGLAIFFRLLAVIFARGWGMIDDHFLVIESAQSWVDGHDYNDWLPGSPRNHGPTGHSFFYSGFHFLLFYFFKLVHLTSPQIKMFIVRFLHAGLSLVTVYYGYRITEKLHSKETARLAALLLALYWFMPWISVRNLVEVVCIPFLVMGVWVIIREEKPARPFLNYLLAGILFGLAFVLRIQTGTFTLGIFAVLLFRKQWQGVLATITGFIIPMILFQGTIDYFIWGKPFAESLTYIRYNLSGTDAYIVLPWYQYFIVVLGLLIPPVSFFLFFGFLRTWKKQLLLFVPVALFFIFHSCISNKQERFILPVIPFIVILGTIGWHDFIIRSGFWQKRTRLLNGCWVFFWVVNLILLPVTSTVYSKRARVETMAYLSRYQGIKYLLVADKEDRPELFPYFYLGQWPHSYDELLENETTDQMIVRASRAPVDEQPQFLLFTSEGDLQARIIKARKSFPFIVYETTIETGMIDKVLHRLNPLNANRIVYIYRNRAFFPDKVN
jgi:hypothetical protein